MAIEEIVELLKIRKTDFLKTKSFSQFPGIYAFFYIGNNFPIFRDAVSKHQIIYIGKTESSQEKRDEKTHFTTGKTGNSTVRKSIGSILYSQNKLWPIPRNNSDYEKGRFGHFKFDDPSEIIITDWMQKNLALSFYEFPESKELIDKLESKIINHLNPILNIDHKNAYNPYKNQIKQLRQNCANIALKNSNFPAKKTVQSEMISVFKKNNSLKTTVSGFIYIDNITKSDETSQIIRIKARNKYLLPVENDGCPTSFSLMFKLGNIDFMAEYKIYSKDGKSRSGILKLGTKIYKDCLKIKMGTILKISKLKVDKYLIEKI